MRLGTLLFGVFVATCALVEVSCITNREFFELVKDYAEDLESFDIDDPAIDDEDDDSSDVIELPGNADDELDIEYLITKFDLADTLQNIKQAKATTPNNSLGWWRRRRRRRRRWHNPCRCRRLSCNCCINHTFKINIVFKRWRFRVKACVNVAYLARDHGFSFTITFNNRRVLHKEYSLRRPPSLCYGVPGLKRFVRACVEVYNINLRSKSLCLRLAAIINVKIKKFRFTLRIGCFRIPLSDDLEGANAMRLLESLQASVEDTETGDIEEVSLSELPTLYRQLQVDMAEKYENQEEESWDNPENQEIESGEFQENPEEVKRDESEELMFEPEEY